MVEKTVKIVSNGRFRVLRVSAVKWLGQFSRKAAFSPLEPDFP
jgi:hypothetical protein